jgi:hypothetical protein
MAELHLANIRSWRHDKYASQSFDAGEMDLLESSLRRIASGMENAGIVLNTARQIKQLTAIFTCYARVTVYPPQRSLLVQ